MCDAPCCGLDAALEQPLPTDFYTVAFASRFLSSNEEQYNVNEFSFLGVVWAEYFNGYLLAKIFPF